MADTTTTPATAEKTTGRRVLEGIVTRDKMAKTRRVEVERLVRHARYGKFIKRRFEARVPVSAIEPAPVGVALNQAANQVAAEVADWIGK